MQSYQLRMVNPFINLRERDGISVIVVLGSCFLFFPGSPNSMYSQELWTLDRVNVLRCFDSYFLHSSFLIEREGE